MMPTEEIYEDQLSALDSSRTIFVGDLSYFCNEEDLYSLFAPFGTILTVRVRRGVTGESLMHGFVALESPTAATTAIRTLDGLEFMGRNIKVQLSSDGQRSGTTKEGLVQVHVSFISKQNSYLVTEKILRDLFSPYGAVADVAIKKHVAVPKQGRQSGYGFVYFFETPGALRAVQALKHNTVNDITLDCSISHKSETSGRGPGSSGRFDRAKGLIPYPGAQQSHSHPRPSSGNYSLSSASTSPRSTSPRSTSPRLQPEYNSHSSSANISPRLQGFPEYGSSSSSSYSLVDDGQPHVSINSFGSFYHTGGQQRSTTSGTDSANVPASSVPNPLSDFRTPISVSRGTALSVPQAGGYQNSSSQGNPAYYAVHGASDTAGGYITQDGHDSSPRQHSRGFYQQQLRQYEHQRPLPAPPTYSGLSPMMTDITSDLARFSLQQSSSGGAPKHTLSSVQPMYHNSSRQNRQQQVVQPASQAPHQSSFGNGGGTALYSNYNSSQPVSSSSAPQFHDFPVTSGFTNHVSPHQQYHTQQPPQPHQQVYFAQPPQRSPFFYDTPAGSEANNNPVGTALDSVPYAGEGFLSGSGMGSVADGNMSITAPSLSDPSILRQAHPSVNSIAPSGAPHPATAHPSFTELDASNYGEFLQEMRMQKQLLQQQQQQQQQLQYPSVFPSAAQVAGEYGLQESFAPLTHNTFAKGQPQQLALPQQQPQSYLSSSEFIAENFYATDNGSHSSPGNPLDRKTATTATEGTSNQVRSDAVDDAPK